MRGLTLLVGCSWAVSACGGVKFDPGDTGVSSGGSGVVVPTGGASTGGTGNTTGELGGQTSSVAACTQTVARASIVMNRDGNPSNLIRGDLTFVMSGEIVAADATSFSIEGCPGPDGSVCKKNEIVPFTVEASGLNLTRVLTVGALARVTFDQRCPWGCNTSILVESIDALNGVGNSYRAASGIYFAANDGGGAPSGAPYNIEVVHLDCPNPYEGTGCGGNDLPGLYLLRFSSPAWQGTVDVPMGTSDWLRAGGGWLQVHNLRSYVSGWCDDYWNWAHWAIDGILED